MSMKLRRSGMRMLVPIPSVSGRIAPHDELCSTDSGRFFRSRHKFNIYMEKGLIQVYYGNGKGKTTAAMGQALRACGHGLKVFVFQFLKSPDESGEVSVLKKLPGIDYLDNTIEVPFLFNLTPEQQEYFNDLYSERFAEIRGRIMDGGYDVVILDEVLDAFGLGLIQEEELYRLMEEKPEGTEFVMTGHEYAKDLSGIFDRADYITKCVKEKHPFDLGIGCRKGIEE